jgi:hypothetical protein
VQNVAQLMRLLTLRHCVSTRDEAISTLSKVYDVALRVVALQL